MASQRCPCPSPWETAGGRFSLDLELDDLVEHHRRLEEEESEGETWEMIYVGVVLLGMFTALLMDKIGADLVMLTALTACMAANIVTVAEGLAGFSNESVLTVVVLFVVAAGVQLTGGLDWYMGKLLGRPLNTAGAQLRLMVPIAFISAFLNNTPVVVIMIPICQKWGKNVGISPAQLLVPLSFASILGGTCTLIGTSTNLVVQGLLANEYPNDPEMTIGLFDLGEFGVPIALVGMSYILISSPYLLPGGKRKADTALPTDDGTILLGARLTKFSPAAGRTVKRSGLRDTGGIYLVSVYRALSGNMHRAVGQDFVLNVDDILYFTGLVNEFAQFCEKNGLEVVTNEVDVCLKNNEEPSLSGDVDNQRDTQQANDTEEEEGSLREKMVKFQSTVQVEEFEDEDIESPPLTIETRKSGRLSHLSAEAEKLQAINRLTDMIRGYNPSQPYPEELDPTPKESKLSGPAKIIVAIDTQDLEDVVIVGINVMDRPGLLLDISRGLHSLGLQLHHTEASVIQGRSISIWRCSLIDDGEVTPDDHKMQAALSSLLENEGGAGATKRRGLQVVRCVITEESRLCGKTLEEIDFRETYKAAIVAVQKKDKSEVNDLTNVVFAPGDLLVVQANDDSPLLVRPPRDFYTKSETNNRFAVLKAVGGIKLSGSFTDLRGLSGDSKTKDNEDKGDEVSISSYDTRAMEAWKDLIVIFHGGNDKNSPEEGAVASREFLAAMEVSKKSEHIGKTVGEAGLDKQSGLFLVGVERPMTKQLRISFARTSAMASFPESVDGNVSETASIQAAIERYSVQGSVSNGIGELGGHEGSINQGNVPKSIIPVPPEGHLQEGDILWFAGPAAAMADLRKIPGLKSLEDDELKQIDEKLHDRRLVQAVVARKGPLVGRTAAQVGFRTRYGAAVIAVHREGTRVQDHPGNIKLQAGDVLLLEAGPTFISRNTDNQQSFALISEVKDSKPPRLNKLIPALLLILTMLIIVAIGPVLFPDQNMSSLLVVGLLTSIIMVCFNILSQQECRDAVNWTVYVTIACAFGIGTAMTNSGLAGVIADGLVSVGNAIGMGHAGLYGAVYLATVIISNIVTNTAAAALMFPIAIDAAQQVGADEKLMSYNLMLAASASFMTPFGYTTNLLIYGPGGYKAKDFLYMGTPMQVILWILTTIILSNTTVPWWVSWLWTFVLFLSICLVFVCPAYVRSTFNRAKNASQQMTELGGLHEEKKE